MLVEVDSVKQTYWEGSGRSNLVYEWVKKRTHAARSHMTCSSCVTIGQSLMEPGKEFLAIRLFSTGQKDCIGFPARVGEHVVLNMFDVCRNKAVAGVYRKHAP